MPSKYPCEAVGCNNSYDGHGLFCNIHREVLRLEVKKILKAKYGEDYTRFSPLSSEWATAVREVIQQMTTANQTSRIG